MGTGDDPRYEDWSAILAARKELGDEYDQAFVEGVVERVAAEVDTRVDARLAELRAHPPVRRRGSRFLALYSITLGIPISAIAGNYGHLAGLAVAWGGIVLVNLVHAWRPGDPSPGMDRSFTIRSDQPRTRNSRAQ